MKNMIKMSLVAAVAVAGLSSTVAAKPLAEAIKDVDVSGSVLYRYNDYTDDKSVNNDFDYSKNYYKIAATLKSKINDTVTANVRVVTGTGVLGAGADNQGSITGLDTRNSADANPTLQVSNASFTAKIAGATVIAGKQGLTTPWTVAIDSDSNEQTGTGLLALVPAGPVTIAAAAFNQTNLDGALAGTGSNNIVTLGAMAKVGPVAVDAWYLDMEDTFDTFTLGAKATVEMVTLEARFTSLEEDTKDAANNTENTLVNLKASAKVGPVAAYVQYGSTSDKGGLTALDSDAKTSITGWNVNIHNKRDADLIRVGAGMDVMSGLNVAINYGTIDYKGTVGSAVETEDTELYTQITHKMGKNLSTYVRFGKFTKDVGATETNDATVGRLQVEYKF